MTTTENKENTINLAGLLARGWTIQEAAARLGRDASHVRRVLTGTRKSKELSRKLAALPPKQLTRLRRAAR